MASFLFIPTQTVFFFFFFFGGGGVYCFHVVRPPITFCFLNILKSHWWNFIKASKHIHIYKTNTLNKQVKTGGKLSYSYFPM